MIATGLALQWSGAELATTTIAYSARNNDQELVGHFLNIEYFRGRLFITIPLKMYRKYGRPKWILVRQMLKLIRKWPKANCYF